MKNSRFRPTLTHIIKTIISYYSSFLHNARSSYAAVDNNVQVYTYVDHSVGAKEKHATIECHRGQCLADPNFFYLLLLPIIVFVASIFSPVGPTECARG
jgi:hypothetical protein